MITLARDDIDLDSLLKTQESSTLAIRKSLKSAEDMARILAAFANADGGHLVVGVNDKGNSTFSVEGSDIEVVKKQFEAAIQSLQPAPQATFRKAKQPQGPVAIISVSRADQPIALNGAVYRRYEDQVRTISAQDLQDILSGIGKTPRPGLATGVNASLNHLACMLAESSKQIERLEKSLEQQQSLGKRVPEWIVSGVIGLLISQLASFLVNLQ